MNKFCDFIFPQVSLSVVVVPMFLERTLSGTYSNAEFQLRELMFRKVGNPCTKSNIQLKIMDWVSQKQNIVVTYFSTTKLKES